MSESETKARDPRLVALDAVWDCDGKSDVKATVAALFRYLNAGWTTTTSIPKLARIAGVDEKTVKARLVALTMAGGISRRDRVGAAGMTSPEWTVHALAIVGAVEVVSAQRTKHTPPVRGRTPGPCMDPRSVDGPTPGPCTDPPPGPWMDHDPGICSGDLFRGDKDSAPSAPGPADAGPESEPTPNQEPDDGRDDREPAGDPEAGGVREGGDGGRGGDERLDADAPGADEASGGRGDAVSGGAGEAGGAELTTLWTWMSDQRRTVIPRAHSLDLTDGMRKALRARVKDHGEDAVRLAWSWMLFSTHKRAVFLREGFGHPKTFLRPDNFAQYLDFARIEAACGVTLAPLSPMHRTALAAWDRYIAPLLTDRRYHSQAPPPAYHADPAKHEVIRRAMYAAGGWAHLSKVRDRAEDVAAFRQTFTATLASELECAA